MLLTTIFCEVDDFCKSFEKIEERKMIQIKDRQQVVRCSSMELSDIMTILVYFHHSGYKNFKHYYERHVQGELRTAFRKLVSYNQFLGLMKNAAQPLYTFNLMYMQGKNTGLGFIDSFSLPVCHNKRIYSHKVFKGIAQRGKTSMGWFYGLKLHFTANHRGETTGFFVTPGNISDNNIDVVDSITKNLSGLLVGDRGYISQPLFKKLFERGLQLVTKIRGNMKQRLMPLFHKLALGKRGMIESIGNIFKTKLTIQHTRHRKPENFFINVLGAIAAYIFQVNKPSIEQRFDRKISRSY